MRVRMVKEAGPVPLSKKQLHILAERASGWSNSELAARLELPRYEVDDMLDEARRIVGATHTPHVVAHAFREGWLA